MNNTEIVSTAVKPLKRAKALKVLSRDHHEGLLVCWKIRTGFNRKVQVERVCNYVNYFFREHLLKHFVEEEKYVFGYLPKNDELRRKAERQHRRLKRLDKKLRDAPERITVTLGEIEEELEAHIRFEERKLFPYLESCLPETALTEMERSLKQVHIPFQDQWKDVFWQKQR